MKRKVGAGHGQTTCYVATTLKLKDLDWLPTLDAFELSPQDGPPECSLVSFEHLQPERSACMRAPINLRLSWAGLEPIGTQDKSQLIL